jgi:hypothetical protein
VLVFAGSTGARAAQATFAWDPVTDPQLAGYRIHYGTESQHYSQTADVGPETHYTVAALQGSTTYYFAATAYNEQGVQSGYSNEVSLTTPVDCTYTISPSTSSVGAGGGAGSVTVTAPSGCAWSATGSQWLTITSGSGGSGNGTVTYSVPANRTDTQRTVATSIAGRIFSLTQTAVQPLALAGGQE